MPVDWEALATALAASPAVEAFNIGPNGEGCYRAEPIDAWLSVRVESRVTVCVRRGDTIDCHARPVGEEYLGCFAWSREPVVEPPSVAAPLLAAWPALGGLRAETERGKHPPNQAAVWLSERWDDESWHGEYLALRGPQGWHTSREPIGTAASGNVLEDHESFDAATVLGEPGLGLVTSYFDGCGNGGNNDVTLTLLRYDGAWIQTVAHRSLGGTTFSRDDEEEGPSRSRFSGLRLRARPAGPHRIRLTIAENRGHGDPKVRADLGLWELHDGQFLRPPRHPVTGREP